MRNDQEIVEFILETDDELSDLRDSGFKDIMEATDVWSDEEFLSDKKENLEELSQPDPDAAGPSAPKKRSWSRPNNAKKAKKGSDKYNELYWASTEPPQPMRGHLFDGQPGVNFIVQSCDSLEFFELIVTDEIVDHIATYSNLYASKANPLVIKSLRKHTCYVSGRTLLLLKSDCILPHWFIVECCTNRKSICIILKTTFLRSQCLDELYHKIKWYY